MSKQPFGLRENPFAAGHDPRLVYESRERKDALLLVRNAIAEGEPFVLVTGDGGTGKTALVAEALGGKDAPGLAVFLSHPTLRRDELLEAICIAFGVESDSQSKPRTLANLESLFKDLRADGGNAVLVMDEAHALDDELLEELRLLSNLETEGRPLLQIILVGLPELERRLTRPELTPLRQRIAVQCQVRPLSAADTERYLHHRVSAVKGNPVQLFPAETCFEIHRFTYGFPREINKLAARALGRAARAGAGAVSPEHVRAALADARIRPEERAASEAEANAWPAASAATPLPAPAAEPLPAPQPSQAIEPAGATEPARTPKPTPRAEPGPLDPDVPVPSASTTDAKAWVSRFMGEGPVVIGSRAMASEAEMGLMADGDLPITPEAHARPVLPIGNGPLRGRTRGPGKALTLAAIAVLTLGVAVVLLPRALRLRFPTLGATTPGQTAPPTTAGAPATADTVAIARPVRARADTASVRTRYSIQVGTYLDRERAEEERDRVAEITGMRVRIWERSEDGATVHKIVLGAYDTEALAEAAADRVLQRGLVQEARVVSYRSRARSRR